MVVDLESRSAEAADPDEAKMLKLTDLIEKAVDKAIAKALAEAVVPKGYERCKVCGDLVKIGKPCAECAAKVAAEQQQPVKQEKPFLKKRFGI